MRIEESKPPEREGFVDKLAREAYLIEKGCIEGTFKEAKRAVVEDPVHTGLQLVESVGIGSLLALSKYGPTPVKLAGTLAGGVLGLGFYRDVFNADRWSHLGRALSDTYDSGKHLDANILDVQNSLGRWTFETGLMLTGAKLGSGLYGLTLPKVSDFSPKRVKEWSNNDGSKGWLDSDGVIGKRTPSEELTLQFPNGRMTVTNSDGSVNVSDSTGTTVFNKNGSVSWRHASGATGQTFPDGSSIEIDPTGAAWYRKTFSDERESHSEGTKPQVTHFDDRVTELFDNGYSRTKYGNGDVVEGNGYFQKRYNNFFGSTDVQFGDKLTITTDADGTVTKTYPGVGTEIHYGASEDSGRNPEYLFNDGREATFDQQGNRMIDTKSGRELTTLTLPSGTKYCKGRDGTIIWKFTDLYHELKINPDGSKDIVKYDGFVTSIPAPSKSSKGSNPV